MKCARDGESPEKKLEEAKAQILKHDYGNYIPVKKTRRFAMVFSVPEQKIVLSEEVGASVPSSSGREFAPPHIPWGETIF